MDYQMTMPLALIVEDNDMNLRLMRDILEMRFEVIAAQRADEALDLVHDHRPDVIVTDVQLPGMDGLAFIRRLRADPSTRDVPIVAVSAHAMKQNIDEALAAGCTWYVTKPLVEDPLVFVDRLADLVATTA